MRFLHGVVIGIVLLSTLVLHQSSVCLHAAPLEQGQLSGWFGSNQQIVGPLQPVNVSVVVPGYTGPATLIVFDSTGQPVGSWEFAIPAEGSTVMQVTPRGAPGDHWAALFVQGQQVTNGIIYRLEAHTVVQTGVEVYDELYERVRHFMLACTLAYPLEGHYVHGYRSPDSPLIWLRDHYYQGRGFRYFESDVTSTIDAFRRAQEPDGSFPDFLARPEYGIPAYRTPVEADVEYLFVQAVYEAWKMTGNDEWLRANLPAMQKAVGYTLSDPLRWEPSLGLVKRPFTIDTWDFEYGPTTIDPTTGLPAPRHWIDDRTKWGIFHGDNTGLAQALNSLAHVEDYLGQPNNAHYHRDQAAAIMARLNNLSWNGSFYRHHVKLIPWDVPGVDEEAQLSLSNAIALNRGVLTIEQGNAIVQEYRSRFQHPNNISFAEWWSIDPPFPAGSYGMSGRQGEHPGYYVNGGVMPLVGGELAQGAFRYGAEEYGFDILQRYYHLIKSTNATFLWYHPTGGPGYSGPNTLPTDGWGSSAMLGGLMEGAAGVEDFGVRFSDVQLSPRWAATTDVTHAYVVAEYAASNGYVAYRWEYGAPLDTNRSSLKLEATGSGQWASVRLLLPTGREVAQVVLNGEVVQPTIEQVGQSRYVVLRNIPMTVVQVQVDLHS